MTLTSLYVALAEQPMMGDHSVEVAHADAVRSACARVLARVEGWFIQPRATGTPATTAADGPGSQEAHSHTSGSSPSGAMNFKPTAQQTPSPRSHR